MTTTHATSAPNSLRRDTPDPKAVFELATGYWASAAVLAANSLGVFKAIQDGRQTAAGVARAVSADQRAVEMLLDVCSGLGLLEKLEGTYRLNPTSSAFLVPGSTGYLGSALNWSMHQYEAWGRLSQAVRTGKPVEAPELHLGQDPDQTRAFVLAMHERALGVAHAVADYLDLAGCKRLLDVGGGPGTYSVLLAQRHPDMRADVLDLPAIAAIADELVAKAGLADRVRCISGDATSGEYGREIYDAVLFCGVLHQMSPGTIQTMLRGGCRALRPGGRVIVCDMILGPNKDEPLFCALFSLQMLLTSNEGAAFSTTECESWMKDAGLSHLKTRRLPSPLPYTVISGTREERSEP